MLRDAAQIDPPEVSCCKNGVATGLHEGGPNTCAHELLLLVGFKVVSIMAGQARTAHVECLVDRLEAWQS